MDHETLFRKVQREKLSKEEAERILEEKSLELYRTNQVLKSVLDENKLILRQYREVVDESNIVSKTDIHGIITYVNDEFCRVSKYTREELIGANHNIIRHPDMPKSVFKAMWRAIRSGKIFKGMVKNRRKDGTTYIVNATIKPIINTKGEIQEYIAIRQDISDLIELQNEIKDTQEEIIDRLGELGESRSKETGYHTKRVAEYSKLLALKYGIPEPEAELIRMASPMHDIGKIAISDSILLKPGKLTKDEFESMKEHTTKGFDLFKSSNRELLKASAIISLEHHEKWDGTGYPRGLKGEEIHIYGRITAVADVFDALGSDRVYKQAWELDKIYKLFKEERGKHFEPKLIDIFFDNLDEFLEIRSRFIG